LKPLIINVIFILLLVAKAEPFLLYCPLHVPHTPLMAPSYLLDKYNWIKDEKRQKFAAMVDALDSSIGQIVETLDDEGIRDNTLILFFSDNGSNSDDGWGSNSPLRGAKSSVFEGGIRTPAFMNWPAVLPSGQKCEQVITVMDLFPTLAAVVGLETKNVKGVSP